MNGKDGEIIANVDGCRRFPHLSKEGGIVRMRDPDGGGVSVLDGVALVAGAAVAAVHIRGILSDDIFGPGWVIVLGTFIWVSVTAAGPFLFLVRKYARALDEYPRVGDWLWALLGLPWLLTALIQTTPAQAVPGPQPHPAAATLLTVGLWATSLIALAVVWMTWVVVTPKEASRTFSPPWTNRVGLLLSIAWPIQCGLGLVVIS
jgi:hypothetical protein